jgi:hypothetical protein
MTKEWIIRTFLLYPIADFCMNCGKFVVTTGSHCTGEYRDHVVVRRNTDDC